MEKSGSVGKSNRSFRSQCWCIVFVFLVIWFGLLYFFSSSTVSVSKIGENIVGTNQTDLPDSSSIRELVREQESRGSDEENGGKMEKEETLGEPKSETEVKGKPFDLFRNTNVDAELISALEKELEPKVVRRNGRKETRSSKKEEEATKIRKPTKMKHEGKSVEKEKEEVAEKPAEKDSEEEVPEKVMEKEPEEVPERLMENPEESRRDRRIRKSARQRRRNRQKREAADESSANKLENLLENNGVVKENALNCSGKYIYIHKLPKKFNQDLLDNCRTLTDWFDMCYFTPNLGLGPRLPQNKDIYSDSGWFDTNQFFLEVIFHNRMKQYECLANDPSKASAIFVPYYAGLDVGRYLWESDGFMRDYDALNLVKWLSVRPEWKKMWGRDHFLIAGRINWDFRRDPKNTSDWGNELLNLPESRNMSILTLESSPWNFNDFAIPYPTYFHPATDGDVFQWQNRMRRAKRRFLFSFAGAPRPHLSESIRNEIIDQCKAAKKKCKLLECINRHNSKCSKPIYVMKMFENSVFCLQPQGDSYTRRSVFDSILAGCIPVFFHPGTAYAQYIWHLPRDHAKYSVFISEKDVKSGRVNIENVLQRIPRQKRVAMREEVIKLIPNVVYADPASRLETLEDAFDLSVRGVIERVESVRRQMESGKIVNSDFGEEDSWKYFTYGTVEPHEWDPFFERKRFVKG